MLLARRILQREHFDLSPHTPAELKDYYDWLDRINRLTRIELPYLSCLPKKLGVERCRQLTVLDVGSGAGGLARQVAPAAARQGWNWEFTNLDNNPSSLELNPGGRNVVGDALNLPFENNAFDIVTATTMTHHLDREEEVVQHFREAWRVARHGLFIFDLHRNSIFASALWAILLALGCPRHIREDGVISVKRGWRVREWRELASRAGVPQAEVWQEHGTRVFLFARKS